MSESLKNSARVKMDIRVRTTVTPHGFLPRNWHSFLRCDQNKTEFFNFFSTEVLKETSASPIIGTVGTTVVCSVEPSLVNEDLTPCNHEEADASSCKRCCQSVYKNPSEDS